MALLCSGSLLRDGRLHGAIVRAMGTRLAGTFSGTLPHSPLPVVEAAAAALRGMRADAVLAVGGGSVIVTARAATIILGEARPIGELCTRIGQDGQLISPRLKAPKLPQIVIPTTPTTAVVKAGAAVLEPHTGRRLALFDPASRARTILLAPELVESVPGGVVLSAGLNALAMAVEGLLSPVPPSPIADAALLHAIGLIAVHLPSGAVAGDVDSRQHLMAAAVLTGQGTDYAGGGVVSALGHAIGARHHAGNGIVNAIMLPAALRFNAAQATAGIGKVATALGLPRGAGLEEVIHALEVLFGSLPIPCRLRDLGVTRNDLGPVANAAMQDWFLRSNPRPVSAAADLVALMEQAL